MSSDLSWDAIVIGSGLGGLTAAAAIANRCKRVLVLERHASFGGAATVYRHGALSIEGSLHEIDGEQAGMDSTRKAARPRRLKHRI